MKETIAQYLGIKKFPFEIKDDNGNVIYSEDSNGYWYKKEFNTNGNVIYYEDYTGIIKNNRPKTVSEYTMEELTAKLGHDFKIKK